MKDNYLFQYNTVLKQLTIIWNLRHLKITSKEMKHEEVEKLFVSIENHILDNLFNKSDSCN